MMQYEFLDRKGTFCMGSPERYSYLYFPIANEAGVLSSVTPTLGGDSKTGQNTFLMEPVSAENLHNNRSSRNFWFYEAERKGTVKAWSATGVSAPQIAELFSGEKEKTVLSAGLLWHQITRISEEAGLQSDITSFAPVGGQKLELMRVKVTNISDEKKVLSPTAAIPLYGRSADNIRDHRHVTSLLHRTSVTKNGVFVNPTLTFDERGHQLNTMVYGVLGVGGDGSMPSCFFPVTEEFIGEGGNFEWPAAVVKNYQPEGAEGRSACHMPGEEIDGYEAMGALRFAELELLPGRSASYIIGMGYGDSVEELTGAFAGFDSSRKFEVALEEAKHYWQNKVNVSYETADTNFDNWMYWVNFQPILRRIYGCSFLPHHDYGKGGRGWRDLWQDCLALLMMNPQGVRGMLYDNFGGVRFDGSNATIIGNGAGEFIADRNNITRVWMDHGVWPFLTTELYMHQSGDLGFLLEEAPYFKDPQAARGEKRDAEWAEGQGSKLLTREGAVYQGTVLEHLLVQHLAAFYDVGEHNHIRLRGADWNDALDMAKERGESVAFTAVYGDNLEHMADLLTALMGRDGKESVKLAEELLPLLAGDDALYDNPEEKRRVLGEFCESCLHTVSGHQVELPIGGLADGLRRKAAWVKRHIRETEWVTDGDGHGWFNGYYDNNGRQAEGSIAEPAGSGNPANCRMMLTGQVFTVMSGVADDGQVAGIVRAADALLYDPAVGGYRLNTDFHELKTDMGRMFGFAYGTKENGAVFSHMATMFANALYRRGFAEEGYKALYTLARHCMDTDRSKSYPGVPEYIDPKGRGMYHYLTGAASWMLLTMVTEVFGVRGEFGDLLLEPKLLPEQFDADGKARIRLEFAGRRLIVEYKNKKRLSPGSYRAAKVEIDGRFWPMNGRCLSTGIPVVPRKEIEQMQSKKPHKIVVTLE